MKHILYILLFSWFLPGFCFSNVSGEAKDSKKEKQEKQKKNSKFMSLFAWPEKANREYATEETFLEYKGKIVRNIEILFVDRKAGTLSTIPLEELENYQKEINEFKLKTNTKIIKNQLLFQEGDPVNPALFADSERLIRINTIYHDAFISMKSEEGSYYVDLVIYVQDNRIWRLIFDASPMSLRLGANVSDFLGAAQELEFSSSGFVNPSNPYSIDAYYSLKNIAKSRIKFTTSYTRQNLYQNYGFKLKRGFFAYNTKWAGHVKFNVHNNKYEETDFDDGYNLKSHSEDIWIARSFPLNKHNDQLKHMRFIVSTRVNLWNYFSTPEQVDDNEDYFLSENFYLGSIGLANRDWYPFEELYQFRQYDYVPKGFNISLTGGLTYQENLGERWYHGLQMNYNKYYEHFGFLQNGFGYGAFVNNRHYEQFTFRLENNYFTNRYKLGKLGFRQFVNTRYVMSFDRPPEEFFSINNSVRGLNSGKLKGTKSLVVSLESVFYTPVDWWSSKGNFFLFADFAYITANQSEAVFSNTLQQGYGVGVRFQNLVLGIPYMEVSIGIYPNGHIVNAPGWNYGMNFWPDRAISGSNLYTPSVIQPDIR